MKPGALPLLAVTVAVAAVGCGTSDPGDSDDPAPTATIAPDGRYEVNLEDCPADVSEPVEGPLRIGASAPLSGTPATLFAPFATGMRAYIDYYNANFGGIDGQEVELIVRDDQYSSDLTVSNVDSLIFDDDVIALAGVVGQPNNLAIRDIANDECVPQLWAISGGVEWGELDDYPWTTGLLVNYDVEAAAWADHVVDELGDEATVGLYYVNNDFGQSLANSVTAAANERGLEVIATETIDPAATMAPNAQLTNLAVADPDAIFAVPLGSQCISFLNELGNTRSARPGFDPLVYVSHTCATSSVFDAASDRGAEGVFSSNNLKDVYDPDVISGDPAVATYLDELVATGARVDPGGLTAVGWIAGELTMHVLEEAAAAGDLSRSGVMDATRNLDYVPGLLREGLTFQMDATDGYAADRTQIVQWQSGHFTPVGEPAPEL